MEPQPFMIWMTRALELARKGLGRTAPNPVVGCVLVRDGDIVGEGYHAACGEPHAEALALDQAGELARGATAYVTLEPCCHHGRTPPCTDALIRAGVTRVVVGLLDPDPRVSGGGIAALGAAGIEVETGVMEKECRRINLPFLHRVRTGHPLVTLKLAVSLDGKIATHTGHSRWITGPAARERVHRLRAEVDAVLVGSGTALADDPELTCRLEDANVKQALRVVLDRRGRLPRDARLLRDARETPTLVMTGVESPPAWRADLQGMGATVETADLMDLDTVLCRLTAHGVNHLLVEGGQRIFTSFIEAGLAQRIIAFVAPVIIGGADAPTAFLLPGADSMDQALRLREVSVTAVDRDAMIEGWLVNPDLP